MNKTIRQRCLLKGVVSFCKLISGPDAESEIERGLPHKTLLTIKYWSNKMKRRNASHAQVLENIIPERQAKSSAFSCLLQKKVSVSPKNQESSSEATSGTLLPLTRDPQSVKSQIKQRLNLIGTRETYFYIKREFQSGIKSTGKR